MSELHDDSNPEWRKQGRCSSCIHFGADFGEPPDLYGHCKIYPRPGSREANDYACQEFRPLEGFAELTGSTTKRRFSDTETSDRSSVSIQRPPKRPKRSALRSAAVVRRRKGDAPREDLDQDVVGALSGTEGGGGMNRVVLQQTLVDLVENFLSIEDVEIGRKWDGGSLIMQPADEDLRPQVLPLESFFHKIVMVRDRLRVLEQKINTNAKLSDADKVDLQQYISRCYGSLTTFNTLFRDQEDRFSSK